jgi:hypothetical protein
MKGELMRIYTVNPLHWDELQGNELDCIEQPKLSTADVLPDAELSVDWQGQRIEFDSVGQAYDWATKHGLVR